MDWLYVLQSVFPSAIKLVVGAVLLLVFIGRVVLSVVKHKQPYTANEATSAQAAASAFLERSVPLLEAWRPAALTDLSNHWEGTRASAFRWSHRDFQQGMLKNLSQPPSRGLLAYQPTGLVAFHLSCKGAYAFLRLCTSEHEVRLDFSPGTAQITSRAQGLGYARTSGRLDYELYDEAGRAIGHYRRFTDTRYVDYAPVGVSGRVLGEVKLLHRRGDGIFRRTPRPAVRNLAPDLTPQEQDWLLAIIGLELLHNLRWVRSPT
jgi:hypothetical protein